ncbi:MULTISPECIES: hypothetical protein [unclassified Streptomyces]|uniref:hypothetical protein n=1 Tax=unclassified Streptomyces TaxID=2593676 RepID=UPI0038634F1D
MGVTSTEEVVAQLKAALEGVGVVLPSLRVDPVTGASEEPFALVALGRCNVRTAVRLADVLRACATEEVLRARVREANRDSERARLRQNC